MISSTSGTDLIKPPFHSTLASGSAPSLPLNSVVHSPVTPSETIPTTYPQFNVDELLTRKLANPALKLRPGESIALVKHCIGLGQQEALKAAGKDLVVFIGNTGSGKSTLVNYLSGCTMQRKNPQDLGLNGDDKVVIVKPTVEGGARDEIMKIGHSTMSMTFIPQIAPEYQGYTYCDCPGFLDNRGVEINISNAANIKFTLGKAQSVRVVMLINYHSLKADRGRGLKDMVNICCNLFGSRENLIKYKNSILLGITQTPFKTIDEDEEGDSKQSTVDDLKKWLASENSINDFDRAALQQLCDQLFIYDPLDSKNLKYKGALKRTDVLAALGHLESINTSLEIFKTVLTPEDLKGLADIADEIKTAVTQILRGKKLTTEDFKQLASYQESLNQLNIIEHPHVIGLARDTSHLITGFFQKLVHQFDLNCKDVSSDLSAQSEAILTTIREGVQYFDDQLKAAINIQSLEQQYALLILTHAARKEKLRLADLERSLRTCCAQMNFVKAQTTLKDLEEGLENFIKVYAKTNEVPEINLLELKTLYNQTKKTYDDNQMIEEQNRKRLEETEKNLKAEQDAGVDKQKAQASAQIAATALDQKRNRFLNQCSGDKFADAKTLLDEIKKDLSAYEIAHGASGINAAIDISQLEATYKTAQERHAQANQLEEQRKKSEQDLKAAQEREAETARQLAAEKAKPQPVPQVIHHHHPQPPQHQPNRGPEEIAKRLLLPFPFGL